MGEIRSTILNWIFIRSSIPESDRIGATPRREGLYHKADMTAEGNFRVQIHAGPAPWGRKGRLWPQV